LEFESDASRINATNIAAEANLIIFLHVESESGYRFACHFVPDDKTIAAMMMLLMLMMMMMMMISDGDV
jgi:hypothetical protein